MKLFVYSFHAGPPLNLWERCSLQSFADHGHEMVLFSYDGLDVPHGVRLRSAADIISAEQRDKEPCPAQRRLLQHNRPFSDLGRGRTTRVRENLHRHDR